MDIRVNSFYDMIANVGTCRDITDMLHCQRIGRDGEVVNAFLVNSPPDIIWYRHKDVAYPPPRDAVFRVLYDLTNRTRWHDEHQHAKPCLVRQLRESECRRFLSASSAACCLFLSASSAAFAICFSRSSFCLHSGHRGNQSPTE